MSRKFLIVEWAGPVDSEHNILFLPHHLFKYLGLESDTPYRLKIGNYLSHIYVQSVPKEARCKIYCSRASACHCNIPIGTSLTLRSDETKSISLGPLVGLLTVNFENPEVPDNPFGKQSKFLKALCTRAQKNYCLTFAFTPGDIDHGRGVVYGYLPRQGDSPALGGTPEHGDIPMVGALPKQRNLPEEEAEESPEQWTRLVLPYPDVIYNRVPSRYWENQELFVETFNFLTHQCHIPVFNPGFLDKYEVHQHLSQLPETSRYMPKTSLYQVPEDLENFTLRFGEAFLKPCAGSLGRRIIRITRTEGEYKYKYRKRDGEIAEGQAATAQQLADALRTVIGDRPFMIQQAIPLAKFEGQEFDARMLMQKDRYGNWRRTKTYVRIVQPGSLTANLSTGAEAKSIVEVIKAVFGQDFQAKQGIGERLRQAALEVACAIEKSFPGIWAEMGIDFGIDIYGRIWLIEVNSKPFRALTGSSGMTRRIERSFLRPMEYAKFLTGFYPHSIY